jgi:hypothetical protein
MDAAGAGALIGIFMLIGIGIATCICDRCKKRVPVPQTQDTTPILRRERSNMRHFFSQTDMPKVPVFVSTG